MAHRVAVRYAAGLFEAANDNAQARKMGEALADYASAFVQNGDLRRFLADPAVPKPAKKELLLRLGNPAVPALAGNFFCLLTDKGRIGLLPDISEAYQNLLAAQTGMLTIIVTSAVPLGEEEIKRVRSHYASEHGGGVRLIEKIDPALIGGIRVQVGDKVYDGSLRARLEGLRKAINDRINGRSGK